MRHLLVPALLLIAFASPGCSGDDEGSTSEGSSASGSSSNTATSEASDGSASATAASASGSGGEDPYLCFGTDPAVTMDHRACSDGAQCAVVVFTSCCGPAAVGVAMDQEDDFEAARAWCVANKQPAPCDCAPPEPGPGEVAVDNGAVGPESQVTAACIEGQCRTELAEQ